MGGSGGGSSGQVDYPDYMKEYHQSWLSEMDVYTDSLINQNPYMTATAFNPDGSLEQVASTLATFSAIVTALDGYADWQTSHDIVSGKFTTPVINIQEQTNAYSAIADNSIMTRVLPQFKRGMQNVGASMGSAFVIGEAIIWANRDRDLSKFQTDLTLKNADLLMQNRQLIGQSVQVIMQSLAQEAELYKAFTHYMMEFNRIRIVAKSEESTNNLEYDVKYAKWPVGAFIEAGNLLASISGTAIATDANKGPNKVTSALAGGISGAAAGASLGASYGTAGGPWGAAIGGIIGAGAGLLGASD